MSLLLDISDRLVDEFGERLTSAPQIAHDALVLAFDNGVILEVRIAAPSEYCYTWHVGDLTFRIDTAPLHPGLATFPNHLHGRDGAAGADPLTDPQRSPWQNARAVVATVIEDPMLQP